jgi:hypothetical protein
VASPDLFGEVDRTDGVLDAQHDGVADGLDLVRSVPGQQPPRRVAEIPRHLRRMLVAHRLGQRLETRKIREDEGMHGGW